MLIGGQGGRCEDEDLVVPEALFVEHEHGEAFQGYELYLFHASVDSFSGDVELVMEGVSRVSENASSIPAVIMVKWTNQPSASKVSISVLCLAFFLLVLRRWGLFHGR